MREIKVKKRRFIIKLCILITILGSLSYLFYWFGYFPVIGNMIAEKKLSKYYSVVKGSVQKVETGYDLYNGKYRSIKGNLGYRLENNSIYDPEVSERMDFLASKQYVIIKDKLSEDLDLDLPRGITVWTELNADDYSIKCQKLYILGIYNRGNISEEESKKMPATIVHKFISLMGEDYNFTGIQLIYADNNGRYTIEFSPNTFKRLEYQNMLKKTRKIEK